MPDGFVHVWHFWNCLEIVGASLTGFYFILQCFSMFANCGPILDIVFDLQGMVSDIDFVFVYFV